MTGAASSPAKGANHPPPQAASGDPAATATRRQKASRRRFASSGPPVASPWTSMAAFMAPALAPLTAPMRIAGSSSRRSSTPQVKAPREPPPWSASVTGTGPVGARAPIGTGALGRPATRGRNVAATGAKLPRRASRASGAAASKRRHSAARTRAAPRTAPSAAAAAAASRGNGWRMAATNTSIAVNEPQTTHGSGAAMRDGSFMAGDCGLLCIAAK